MCIGWLCGGAQPGPAQGADRLLALQGGRGELVRELDELLRTDPGGWRRGWRRARQVGPALAPVLWDRLRRERSPMRRLLWIGAYAAAAGPAGGSLLDAGWLRGGKRAEQVMALLALALEPGPPPDPAELRRLAREAPSDAVRLAACLVLARAPGPTALPADWLKGARRRDPGLAAAALLCGGGAAAAGAARWLSGDAPPDPAAELVWRAALLTRHPGPGGEPDRRRLARRAVQWRDEPTLGTQLAAAAFLATAEDADEALDGGGEPWPPERVAVLARSAAGRELAARLGWLVPVPSPRLDPRLRRRLAAAHALRVPGGGLGDAAAAWRGDADLVPTVCLALAWRARAGGTDLSPGPWIEVLQGVPEGAWLRLALGLPLPAGADAAGLGPEFALAAAGRLPPAAVARELERALWRRGGHPGLAVWEVWTGLVRDLLLSGSDQARARDARRQDYPYLPGDLQRDDREFFGVALEYFDWALSELGEVPRLARLRP